ncbi:MAG: hypothetical protein MR598_06975 [Erysipelotrichaceae bacterium]|nr:hypothetical protein [Erysipelotrichaceae bacterium]
MILKEGVKNYGKEAIFDIYSRLIDEFKPYDKITKVKMIDEICCFYSDYHHIIDICTVRELKYLKLLLGENEEVFDSSKYSWEIGQLSEKLLILRQPTLHIPDDFYDPVCMALKKVKWKEARWNDRINEVLVGCCKVYGELLTNVLVEFGSAFLGLCNEDVIQHISDNLLFHYYVYFSKKYIPSFNDYQVTFIFRDYYDFLDELEDERKKQGIAYSGMIDIYDYIYIFYYDVNINRKKVKNFYQKIQKITPFYSWIIEEIRIYSLLNVDRSQLKIFLEGFLKLDGKERIQFFQLLDQAMDEMPSGALNGATPNDAKLIRLEQEKISYQKEVNYIRQQDAKLNKKEVKTFYKVYFALLEFTNQKYQVNSKIKKIYKQNKVNPANIIEIVDKFWNCKEVIIDEFMTLNPYRFCEDELNLVEKMKKGIRGIFIIARYQEDYTMMIHEEKVYMVKGLHDNIDNIISYHKLPLIVQTSIFPFYEKITYDGIFQSIQDIRFGVELDRMVDQELEQCEKVYSL